jgi:DegV family protein with EDD domain
MKDYVIFTDSCADLSPEMLRKLDVKIQNMHFKLANQEYLCTPNEEQLRFHEFYEQLRQGGTASTSQVSPAEYMDTFHPVLKEGKDILYIGFSSGLSGTVNAARIAANELEEHFPASKIRVVDSLSASMGQGLLVWYAAAMRKQGKSLDEVVDWVEANKLRMVHWFTVDDLNFLRRGGRLSGTTAFVGTMLNIKPLLHFDDLGHLSVVSKIRGRQKSLLRMADEMEKTACEPQKQTVFISHGDCLKDAQFLANEIRSRFEVKEIHIHFIGPIIGGHSGPGTVALFFLAQDRNVKDAGCE